MRSALFTVFVSVGSVAAGPLANAQTPVKAGPQSSSTIAVVNVTVIPMDRERAIPDQAVLIHGDRIAAIGSTSEISVSEGALVIGGKGGYVLPGLTDAHVHLSTNLPWAPARPDHAPVNLGLDAMLDAHQSLAHVNTLSNVYFMPLASRTGTLLISLGSFAGVLAAAGGLALCPRNRHRTGHPPPEDPAETARWQALAQ